MMALNPYTHHAPNSRAHSVSPNIFSVLVVAYSVCSAFAVHSNTFYPSFEALIFGFAVQKGPRSYVFWLNLKKDSHYIFVSHRVVTQRLVKFYILHFISRGSLILHTERCSNDNLNFVTVHLARI